MSIIIITIKTILFSIFNTVLSWVSFWTHVVIERLVSFVITIDVQSVYFHDNSIVKSDISFLHCPAYFTRLEFKKSRGILMEKKKKTPGSVFLKIIIFHWGRHIMLRFIFSLYFRKRARQSFKFSWRWRGQKSVNEEKKVDPDLRRQAPR